MDVPMNQETRMLRIREIISSVNGTADESRCFTAIEQLAELLDTPDSIEPVFPIRAQDALAPSAVEAWATLAEIAGTAQGSATLADQARQARDIASRMRAWQRTNSERVKWPD